MSMERLVLLTERNLSKIVLNINSTCNATFLRPNLPEGQCVTTKHDYLQSSKTNTGYSSFLDTKLFSFSQVYVVPVEEQIRSFEKYSLKSGWVCRTEYLLAACTREHNEQSFRPFIVYTIAHSTVASWSQCLL